MFRAALAVLSALLLAGCESSFFYPDGVDRPFRIGGARKAEVTALSSDSTELHGWVIEPEGKIKSTCVFFHGNAENLTSHANFAGWLVKAGHRVVIFDYRGYGKTKGEPEIGPVNSDARAMLDWALKAGYPEPLWAYGQSLGGSLAVQAVAQAKDRESVRLLVVDCTFSSYREIVAEKLKSTGILYPFSPLAGSLPDEWSADRWVDKLAPVPVLFIHGASDPVIPHAHSEKLHSLASEPKGLWLARGAGHGEAALNPDLQAKLLEKIEEYVVREGPKKTL